MMLIAIGTRVQIGGAASPIEAVVIAICIYANERITYQVRWWDNRTAHCEWLEAAEVVPSEDQRVPIGFGPFAT